VPNPQIGFIGLDKLAHAICFGLLAMLLILARIMDPTASQRKTLIVSWVIASVYAVIDEGTQAWTQRCVALDDLAANLIGVFTVAAWIAWRWANTRQVMSNADLTVGKRPINSSVEASQGSGAFVGDALWVGALTAFSRVLGLVRDAVLAACFGLSSMTDAFWIGFLVPNLFRRLFGEGALTAAFIPVYTDLRRQDPMLARRLAWMCVAFLFVVLGALTLLGEILLWFAKGHIPWSQDTLLAIRLTMIMLPYMPLICVVALLGGLLQVHRRFGPPAAVPILLNLTMIIAALFASLGARSGSDPHHAITVVSVSVVLAGLLQLIWQCAAALRCEPLTTRIGQATGALKSVLVLMLPMALGLAVFQINTLLDSLIAWGLSPPASGAQEMYWFGFSVPYPVASGAVTALQYAQRLYQFPLGVFGIAVATAIFPALAQAASPEKDVRSLEPFRKIIQQGLRLTVFIGLPASIGLILVRVPLVRVIFERRQFALEDSLRVATILTGYASAVWAYSMAHVLTRAFYALKDARTPLRISLIMVAVNLMLNLVLVWWLGAAALAWSTALSGVGQVVLLLLAIRRHVDQPVDRSVWSAWAMSMLLTAFMAAVLITIVVLYNPVGRFGLAVQLLILVAVGIAVVLGGAKLIAAQELQWLLKRRAQ